MEVRVYENTSIEGIRRSLSGFGRFSRIEIDEEKSESIKGKCFIFREVGFFKGLHQRIFKRKEELDHNIKISQIHLYELSKKRPDIQKLLGSSVFEKASWQVGEFREKLKIKTDFIRRDENDNLLHVPSVADSKVGVIDARISKIKADSAVSWQISNIDKSVVTGTQDVKSESENIKKIIKVVHQNHPNAEQLRAAYKSALSEAAGTVVISPIIDVPVDKIKARHPEYASDTGIFDVCSDESIRILLEEIDNSLKENNNINSVTIARNDAPDDRFLSRVHSQRVIIDNEKIRTNEPHRECIATMPEFLKFIDNKIRERDLFKISLVDTPVLYKTVMPRVSISESHPENIAADTAFLSFDSLSRSSSALAARGQKQLQRVCDLTFNPLGLAKREADAIFRKMALKWSIDALELPVCELPTNKLYVMRSSVDRDGVKREPTKGLSKEFFIKHLEGLTGRVVIDASMDDRINNGLWQALRELSGRPEGLGFTCVIASANTNALKMFQRSVPEEEALQYSFGQTEVASRTLVAEANTPASGRGKFKPEGGKLAPRSAGVHFLSNPPLDLMADRTIVPTSVALASGIKALLVEDLNEIGRLDTGRLISVPDAFMQSGAQPKPDQIKTKFLDILGKCSGSVVISPPYDQVEALSALCSAVYQACEVNPLLSVSFAVTDKKIQENLTSAASKILIDRSDERELDIGGGDEDDLENWSIDWKSA